MFKIFTMALLSLFSAVAFAAVDVNKATRAELEEIKGIGTSLADRMLQEREKGSYKNWADLIERVKGVGPGNAKRFSSAGMTIGGTTFEPAALTAPAAVRTPRTTKAAANDAAGAPAADAGAKLAKKPAQ